MRDSSTKPARRRLPAALAAGVVTGLLLTGSPDAQLRHPLCSIYEVSRVQ